MHSNLELHVTIALYLIEFCKIWKKMLHALKKDI
jgi:hypothetical protein